MDLNSPGKDQLVGTSTQAMHDISNGTDVAEDMDESNEGDSNPVDDDPESDANVDDEEEPESDMIVLDPEHPLMQRFQKAYKQYLTKQCEKAILDLKELKADSAHYRKQREDIGVELYGLQQELARQQMLLEKCHDSFAEEHQQREGCEARLSEMRTIFKQVIQDVEHQRKKARELQVEVEGLASKVLYVGNAKEDVRSNIAVMKRTTEKSDTEMNKAQQEKRLQDMLISRLMTAVEHLHEDINLYSAQIVAQLQETKSSRENLTDATTEWEAINLEKRQLLQQWNNSLINMKRRDEALAVMQQAVGLQAEQVKVVGTELDGCKRQITKAQEENEQLTYVHNRIESDISSVRKLLASCANRQEALKIEYSTYSKALHETEQRLSQVNTEVTLKENEAVVTRKQIEREFSEKVKLEDLIMEKMQEQLTADKASQFSKKAVEKLRQKVVQLDQDIANMENVIGEDLLRTLDAKASLQSLQETFVSISEAIRQKNETITKVENEIVKRNAVIEKKEGSIDQLSKRIESLSSKKGESYVGPLEFEIKNLHNAIEAKNNECVELQQFWLRQQGDLVKIIQNTSEQRAEIDSKEKQATILLQKKMRLEGEIKSEASEIGFTERSIRAMQHDMTKLNTLIHKNRDMQNVLQQDNMLLENRFLISLKEAEMESLRVQDMINSLKEEKERLLNALVEAERQMMLWEKKTQLAKDARAAVDSEVGQGEIRAMRAEIHRMEVRYAQLMRQQEKMILDMEKSVFRRECIVVRGDAQAKMDRRKGGKPKTKAALHKTLVDMRGKMKSAAQNIGSCDEEIQALREEQQELSRVLNEHQSKVQQLRQLIDSREGNIDEIMEMRQRNLTSIISSQQRVKLFTSLKAGKYKLLCKETSNVESEMKKQQNRLQALLTVIDRLNKEYPEMQTALRKLSLQVTASSLMSSRTTTEPSY